MGWPNKALNYINVKMSGVCKVKVKRNCMKALSLIEKVPPPHRGVEVKSSETTAQV